MGGCRVRLSLKQMNPVSSSTFFSLLLFFLYIFPPLTLPKTAPPGLLFPPPPNQPTPSVFFFFFYDRMRKTSPPFMRLSFNGWVEKKVGDEKEGRRATFICPHEQGQKKKERRRRDEKPSKKIRDTLWSSKKKNYGKRSSQSC